ALTLRRTVRAYNDGHLDEARKAVREALALRPDHAHSYFVLGNIEVRAERYAEAEQALQAYLAREPQGKYAEKARKTLSDLSRVREQGTR
ncbi:MAG TPA: tetratricopeptide repeat protein, partial [Holophaga sp.]|nr:tetratricopeptide repeat protein [Holophaga sp.]